MSNDEQWSQVQIISNIQSPKSRHSMSPMIAKLPSPVNLMESSLPQSQQTTHLTSELSQITLKMKQFSQYKEGQKCSNLERLKNLPRNIQKNSKIKIECKTQFPLVRAVALGEFGWTLMTKQNHKELVNVIWTDSYVTEQLVNRLRPYQKINHFPYSTQMGRKDYLFANLNRMREKHKQEYDFFARTWIFPQDYARFKEQTHGQASNSDKFYIVKPVASCQGKGIHLCRRQQVLYHNSGYHNLLVQEYISNPLLLQNLKFDTRLYVLVKSLQPLQLYLYQEGLTRLATAPYQPPSQQNYRNTRMHLTNYAINKNNPAFVNNRDYNDDAQGHKRSLSSMYEEVRRMGGDVSQIKDKIDKIIVKTILAVYERMTYLEHVSMKQKELVAGNNNMSKDSIQKNISIIQSNDDGLFSTLPSKLSPLPTNQKAPKTSFQLYLQKKLTTSPKCFELLGFDIMLTDKFEPKLIEINHQPSLTASSPLDFVIKKCLVMDVFGLLGVDSRHKERYLSEKKDKLQVKGDRKQARYMFGADFNKRQQNLGGFKCIYPAQKQQQKQLYYRLMPLLTFSQQPHRNKLHHNGSYHPFSSSSPLSKEPQLSFRQPRTSLQTRRKEYTCNYINMFTNGTLISHFQHLPGDGYCQQSSEHDTKEQHDCIENQQDNKNRAMIRFSQNDARISEPPEIRYSKNKIKVNLSKMEQIELPKKNLNFTIKYKRNSTSSNNRANSLNPKLHSQMEEQQGSPQHVSLTNKPTHHIQIPLVPNIIQLVPSQSKTQATKVPSPLLDKPLSQPNQLSIINQHSIFSPTLHLTNDHCQQSRIAIKLINQNSTGQDKANFSLITKNLSLESSRGNCFTSRNDRNLVNSQQRNTRQPIQVEKYAYPVFEKGKAIMSRKSKSLMSNTHTTMPTPSYEPLVKTVHQQPQKPIQRHQQYFDSVYEKQLMIRLGKMKTMKQKLQRLKKNYTNKKQPNVVSPSQLGRKIDEKSSIKEVDRLQSLESHQIGKNAGNEQKPKPYQTIKLLEFQQPEMKRNRHTHNEKRERINMNYDNSLELFEDKSILRKQLKSKNQHDRKLL